MLRRRNERGDTIVEVLFAVAIFSLVAVGAFSLVNQGVATAQRSLESTLVRQEMDSQAETLRFMHNAYTASYRDGVRFDAADRSPAAEWSRLIGFVKGEGALESASTYGTCPDVTRYSDSMPDKSFFVDPLVVRYITDRNAMTVPETWAQIRVDGSTQQSSGLWIEGVPSQGPGIGYIDFHIRACWDAPGLSTPMTLGTIVRLYDPR